MNFEPIVEHGLLRESVRHFFERELPEARIRDMDRARHIPRSLWKRFAAMSWIGLSVPAVRAASSTSLSAHDQPSRIQIGTLLPSTTGAVCSRWTRKWRGSFAAPWMTRIARTVLSMSP